MTIEKRIQKGDLAARAIDDLTLEPIRSGLTARLLELNSKPIYKDDGFFVFSDIAPDKYNLKLSKIRYQSREIADIDIPMSSDETVVELDLQGENELITVIRSKSGNNVIFDTMRNVRTIAEGSEVTSQGFSTVLVDEIPNGLEVSQAKLLTSLGFDSGKIVRIRRDKSLKLRPGPYYFYPKEITLVVGKITDALSPETQLADIKVELIAVNSVPIGFEDVGGTSIAFFTEGGVTHAFGTADDLITKSNNRGDYNFYFTESHSLLSVFLSSSPVSVDLTLRASGNRYATQEKDITMEFPERNYLNFELNRI